MVALWQFLLVLISLPLAALGSTQLLGKRSSVGQSLKVMARMDSAKLKDLFVSSLLILGVEEQFLLQTL